MDENVIEENTGKAKVIVCQSWDQFIFEIRKTQFIGSLRIYRGHRDSKWQLSSKWERYLTLLIGRNGGQGVARLFSPGEMEKIRNSFLERFRQLAWEPEATPHEMPENELWALGRHHGLLTPLLDWTRSPYIAAYFAYVDMLGDELGKTSQAFKRLPPKITGLVGDFSTEGLTSGVVPMGWEPAASGTISVWRLHWIENRLRVGNEFELINPHPQGAVRQIRQQGVFTRLSHGVHLDVETYLASKGLARYLERFDLPAAEYKKAMIDFRHMSISQATLYQDLDGAAREANMGNILDGLIASEMHAANTELGEKG